MEKYEIEERLHKVFKNSLDMKAQWIFKIQSTILMVSSTIFAVMVSLANVSMAVFAIVSFWHPQFY